MFSSRPSCAQMRTQVQVGCAEQSVQCLQATGVCAPMSFFSPIRRTAAGPCKNAPVCTTVDPAIYTLGHRYKAGCTVFPQVAVRPAALYVCSSTTTTAATLMHLLLTPLMLLLRSCRPGGLSILESQVCMQVHIHVHIRCVALLHKQVLVRGFPFRRVALDARAGASRSRCVHGPRSRIRVPGCPEAPLRCLAVFAYRSGPNQARGTGVQCCCEVSRLVRIQTCSPGYAHSW